MSVCERLTFRGQSFPSCSVNLPLFGLVQFQTWSSNYCRAAYTENAQTFVYTIRRQAYLWAWLNEHGVVENCKMEQAPSTDKTEQI